MAPQPGRSRLLVVENNERIRKVIEEMLGVLGHEIVGRASTATAAVAEADTTLPDVALMGVKLDGGGDGIAVTYSVKNPLAPPNGNDRQCDTRALGPGRHRLPAQTGHAAGLGNRPWARS